MYTPSYSMSSETMPQSPVRLGIIGVAGGGKTFSALTAPNPIVADADNKLSGYRRTYPEHIFPIVPFWNRDFVVKTLGVKNKSTGNDDKYPHNMRDAVKLWLAQEAPKLTSEQTLIVDSMTSFNDNGFDIQSNLPWEKSFSKKTGEEDAFVFWKLKLAFNNEINTLLKNLSCHVISIFHELPERDENGRVLSIKPLVQGQSADRIPGNYTDFYRQRVVTRDMDIKQFPGLTWKDDNEREIYAWQTCKDKYFQIACCSNPKLAPFVRANFREVFGV